MTNVLAIKVPCRYCDGKGVVASFNSGLAQFSLQDCEACNGLGRLGPDFNHNGPAPKATGSTT